LRARGAGLPDVTAAIRHLPVTMFGAQLWLVDLTVTPASYASLSPAERARAERFVFEIDRRRFRTAHVALRELLAPFVGCEASDIEFGAGAHDKPFVVGVPQVRFNMSHSGERALVAIARGLPPGVELGVDIEDLREVTHVSDLAAAHFTPTEQRELAESAPSARNHLFLSGWTRKEACLKAVGSGLSIAPDTFDCALAPGRARTRIATATGTVGIEVESLDVETGYLAAIAVTQPDLIRAGSRC
jgi:4'-phosphopantetheinyl transferase